MTQTSGQRKNLSVNHSSTVDSAITLPDITGIIAAMIPHGILIHQILLILTKAYPTTIQNQHQPLFWTVSTAPSSADYCFYSTPIQKSKGTSYCSMNSKSFYCSQQSCRITIAFGGNSFHPQQKQITLRDSSSLLAASKAPSSLYNEAKPSVFSRL